MAFQFGMLMQLSMLLVLLLAATNAVAAAATTTRASARGGGAEKDAKAGGLPEIEMAKPNCKAKCGNIEIPYPFGIGDDCCFRPEFNITCIESNNREPTLPRLMKTRMIVADISLEEGELQIMQLVNRDCYDRQGNLTGEDQSISGLSVRPPYTVSGDKNMVFAVGCDTYARFVGIRDDQNYTTGCISVCKKNISGYAIDYKNDSCSGMGCCETKIPPLLSNLNLTVGSYENHTSVWNFNPCGYAFVVRKGNFTFNSTSFQQLKNTHRLPLVLDWEFSQVSCQFAQDNGTFACKGNSQCKDTPTGGYICVCNPGFQGNPYLDDCQDIDECTTSKSLCTDGQCNNTVGNYTCTCDSGYKNPKGNPIMCIQVPSTKRLAISLSVSLSFSVLLVAIFWIHGKKRRSEKLRYLRAMEDLENKLRNKTRIFNESEVEKATNNYAKEKIVGKGRYAIVYKGVLDEQYVAIKKSNDRAPIDQTQITTQWQFANEMMTLYQINHKNVVRLVGCCLATQTPIVVYEFIENGNLYTQIHGKEGKKPSSPLRKLEPRLKIAAKTAGALAYLHHDTFRPIIHGDVKTANILLDGNLKPKLSNFEASRLVPKDKNQESTLDHGTEGYVDPEHLKSKSLTKKSDVYSFGVVLAELLTSQMAISPEKPEAERELANVFVSKVDERRLNEILDQEIVKWHPKTVTKAADLAKRCLRLRREERPSMREVAAELEGLVRTMEQHPSGGEAKDTGILVASSASAVDITTSAECKSSMQITHEICCGLNY